MSIPTIKMPIGVANIEIKRGTTFDPVLYIYDENNNPVDLTGWTTVLNMYADDLIGTPLYVLSSANGRLIPQNGAIAMLLTAADTTAITFDRANFELLVTDLTSVTRCYLQGSVRVVN